MKFKGLLIVVGVIMLGALSSCKGGYTCPTYLKNSEVEKPIMVKQLPESSEINS